MKSDFTRLTFDREKHYSTVRWQQGRVQTDADWNEQIDILAHLDRTTRRDVIGKCGGPLGKNDSGEDLAGFFVEVVDGELLIKKGRYYVEGLLVENEFDVNIIQQPDLPNLPSNTIDDVLTPPPDELVPGTYIAYLDVWERHITALDDASIREVALGGPDTTTRTKIVWQVKLLFGADSETEEEIHCASSIPLWDTITAPSNGMLSARAELSNEEVSPCIVPAQAGYRGLENQLYRVEIHRIKTENEITIKWSRENGSVVFKWEGQDNLNPNKLILNRAAPEKVLGLKPDNWVELIDDKHELRGEPGLFVKVVKLEGNVLTIDPGSETVDIDEFPSNPKVRRWDMPRDVGEITVDLTVADNWIELESGVEIKLEPGTYRTGDYWLIPARTAIRDIEWPRDDLNNPLASLPHGVEHHYCRLAVLNYDGEIWERLSDCRNLFPPLTQLLRFYPVGGDGQETMPAQLLPQPIRVAVSNGLWPVEGAQVAFNIIQGGGQLQSAGVGPAASIVVETSADGVAECQWQLDATTDSQVVEANLLEIDGKIFTDGGSPILPSIHFNANLNVQLGGGCCTTVGENGEFERLDEAIKILLEKGRTNLCICLLPGKHVVSELELDFSPENPIYIKITGCGKGSRIYLERPIRFFGVNVLTLHDLVVELRFVLEGNQSAITIDHCSDVTITSSHIMGYMAGRESEEQSSLLSITNSNRILLRDNVLESAIIEVSMQPIIEFYELAAVEFQVEIGHLVELYRLPQQGELEFERFRRIALESSQKLASLNQEERKRIQEALHIISNNAQFSRNLSHAEIYCIRKLISALFDENPSIREIHSILLDIRRAAIKTRPGIAIILGSLQDLNLLAEERRKKPDEDDRTVLENNEIIGILSLYGIPPSVSFIRELIVPKLDQNDFPVGGDRSRAGGLGALHMHGNQLVRITSARQIFERLLEIWQGEATDIFLSLFDRFFLSDNAIEGPNNWIVCVYQSMSNNDFTMNAAIPTFRGAIGFVIADSSIYVGNHSGDPDWVLRDFSRRNTETASLDITIA